MKFQYHSSECETKHFSLHCFFDLSGKCAYLMFIVYCVLAVLFCWIVDHVLLFNDFKQRILSHSWSVWSHYLTPRMRIC